MKRKNNFNRFLSVVAYILIVSSCINSVETVKAENIYDDDDFYDDMVWVFCEEEKISIEVGESKKIKVDVDDDYDTDNELIWESDDDSIASVDDDGIVTGNSSGKTTIRVYYGESSDKCIVKVKNKTPSYSKVSKKLKKIAKNNKNFTYDTIDAGNKCRLYVKTNIAGVDDTKIKSQLYAGAGSFQPYIEVRKNGSGSTMKLVIYCKMDIVSYYEVSGLTASQLKISTSNRKISLDLNETYSSDYIENNLFRSTSKAKAVVSSNSDKNTKTMTKFNKMLDQKSLTFKFLCEDGAYFRIGITQKDRKLIKKLNDQYSKVLKLY